MGLKKYQSLSAVESYHLRVNTNLFVNKVNRKGRYITRNIRYIGTAEKLLEDLNELDKLRRQKP